MFPLLATAMLLQVGVFHYIHDGPYWHTVASMTEECRVNWWSTLLYVQNYVHPMVRTIYDLRSYQVYEYSSVLWLWFF